MIDDRNVLSGSAMKVVTCSAFFKYFGLSSGIATARGEKCAEIICCFARGRYFRRAFCWAGRVTDKSDDIVKLPSTCYICFSCSHCSISNTELGRTSRQSQRHVCWLDDVTCPSFCRKSEAVYELKSLVL